jgi:hypothetical protein
MRRRYPAALVPTALSSPGVATTLGGTDLLDMRVIFVDIPPGTVPVGLEVKEASDAHIRDLGDPVRGAGWRSGGSAGAAAAG